MTKISAAIITFNEEKNIERCLKSLEEVADEIIVVDSYSSDKTEAICLEHGVKFIKNKWPGYTEQKNFANNQASFNHILSLDADEALSEELRKNILLEKEKGLSTAYEMNRLTNYCGHWIKHGSWYPDRQLRLFDRTKGQWKGEKIHEKFVLTNGDKPRKLKGNLLHYSYYSIAEHIDQANHFTTITAEVAFAKGKKASLIKIMVNPAFKFVRDFFLKLGFLDGYHGYLVAKISANATFLKYSKLRHLNSGNSPNFTDKNK
jgi:glycosyltransferase involved in cell wall biosynthesis